MYVGQVVWHVGKNVTTKQVRVLWMAPDTQRNSRYNSEALVLVEKEEAQDFNRYTLIPLRRLSEVPPVIKCKANITFHINGSPIFCDRPQSHILSTTAYEMLHHYKSDFREIFWTDENKREDL